MIGEKPNKEVSQQTLMLVMNAGFKIEKSMINDWFMKKFKIKLYAQWFSGYYIGTITIDGKTVNHLDENKKYVKSENIEQCYDRLVVFAFQKINELLDSK